ncbi:hypothetical protein PF007_g12950 [Phytophthora fragariae]|nr:hypothetical protein PF007_g12950 [Phytophthora fragariae]KAE9146012.1 hypothetical protein PF006_g9181 [Phytophthora fragariae]KAE9226337.1 hypothetical protein PF004_g11675 [Phytophthora fragariae]
MARQAQSDRFQEATHQIGGQDLYSACSSSTPAARRFGRPASKILAFTSEDVYVHEVVFYSGVKMMCADYIDFTPTFVLDGYKLLNETYE